MTTGSFSSVKKGSSVKKRAAAMLARLATRVQRRRSMGALARTAQGAPCNPHSVHAASWCLEGGLMAENPTEAIPVCNQPWGVALAALREVVRERFQATVPDFNDDPDVTERHVRTAIKEAVRRLLVGR